MSSLISEESSFTTGRTQTKKRGVLPFKGRRITIVAFTRKEWLTLPPDEQEYTCHKRQTLEEQSSVKCYLRVKGVPSITEESTCHKRKSIEEQSSVTCYLRVKGVPSISEVSTCNKRKSLEEQSSVTCYLRVKGGPFYK